MQSPLILLTNDDGIESPGLWAAAEALAPLGELLMVAPDKQWSGAGRSMPQHVTGTIKKVERQVAQRTLRAYAIDASPALCVIHGMLELVERQPALVVSGINFGENLSTEITVSGTVGAALEGAAFGIPGLALSLEMPISDHITGGDGKDYAACQKYTHDFARFILDAGLPYDVDMLNINVPADATVETPWQMTRLSRRRYFLPLAPARDEGIGRPGYTVMHDPTQAERNSDIWAIGVARVISVTPLTMDMTARGDFAALEEQLRAL
jgi:5'-nucleotidase